MHIFPVPLEKSKVLKGFFLYFFQEALALDSFPSFHVFQPKQLMGDAFKLHRKQIVIDWQGILLLKRNYFLVFLISLFFMKLYGLIN